MAKQEKKLCSNCKHASSITQCWFPTRTQRKLCKWCKVSLMVSVALVLVLGVVVLI